MAPDLIFTLNGGERLNACIKELEKMKDRKFERLFVWEQGHAERKNESLLHIAALLFALVLIYFGKKYLSLY